MLWRCIIPFLVIIVPIVWDVSGYAIRNIVFLINSIQKLNMKRFCPRLSAACRNAENGGSFLILHFRRLGIMKRLLSIFILVVLSRLDRRDLFGQTMRLLSLFRRNLCKLLTSLRGLRK